MTTFAKIAGKQWLAAIAVATPLLRASAQTPLLLGDDGSLLARKCTDLVVADSEVVGEVCASMEGSNMEVTISATHGECVLTETHVCNMPVEGWESALGTKTYTYAIDTDQVYMFTCALGVDEGIYVVAGHGELACDFVEEGPLMAYYEMGIACPPDQEETTTAAPETPPPGNPIPATTATPVTNAPGTTAAPEAETTAAPETETTAAPETETTAAPTRPTRSPPSLPTTTIAVTTYPTTPAGPDETVIGTPECPNTQCVEGKTYVTESCECTQPDSPCDACPAGTRCQEADENEGIPLMCIDCKCGFCDSDGGSCCSVNAQGNNCKDESNDRVCNLQNDYWPAHIGSGNTCAGVEVTKGDPKNGCGCKPSHLTPCTYNQKDQTDQDRCYVCSAKEIFSDSLCTNCKDCLMKECNDACVENANTETEMSKCLSSKNMDGCRQACATAEGAPCIKA